MDLEGKNRFSLLLLEPGEIYFEDFAVIYHFPEELLKKEDGWVRWVDSTVRGRLKVCSKSLVFDPRDIHVPIIKFPLKSIEAAQEYVTTITKEILNSVEEATLLEIKCNMTVEMLEGGVLQPYKFCREEYCHRFELVFLETSQVLPQICQLQRASTLPPNDQNTMIQAIVRSRQRRKRFDRALLENLSETEVIETQANKVTPLVTNPGTILLTNAKLYFQPHNNAEKHPVIKIGIPEIRQVIRRRYLLRQVGLELYCRDSCMVKHLLLTFKETDERDKLYEALLELKGLNLDDTQQDNISYQWQAGAISNYDYLCHLNRQADRSVNDLTQYPVFPWVLADYVSETLDLTDPGIYRDLSKPVGALNEERLKRLKERCKDMPEPRFLYGSHYSTPGFVLYYLVREYPQYMLCLQNGRFDHPDRMFNSLADTWDNVTTNPSDFKELIPEFYNDEGTGDFLCNFQGINFGMRQNGKAVGNVELPPWADGPQGVLKKMREALESDYVSNNLHHWIDLIFGYKQNGEEAEKADNLFYYLCYEGAVDLAEITDLNERLAHEVQITEFGQVPKQLFQHPHPRRSRSFGLYNSLHLTSARTDSCESSEGKEEIESDKEGNFEVLAPIAESRNFWQRLAELKQLRSCRVHREGINAVAFSADSGSILTAGQDALLKIFTLPEFNQIRSLRIGSLATASCLHIPGTDTVLIGSWDNVVYRYSLQYSHVDPFVEAHNDAISCMEWRDNILVTGSWDCTVKVWKLEGGADGMLRRKEKDSVSKYGKAGHLNPLCIGNSIVCEMDHDSMVTCVALHPGGSYLAVGTHDGVLVIWVLPKGIALHQVNCHVRSINAVAWNVDEEHRILTAGDDGLLTIVDARLGTKICVHDLKETARSVVWNGRLVIAGGISGDLILFDMGTGSVVKRFTAHRGPVTCVTLSSNCEYLASGGEDRQLIVWGLGD
ncbi:protein FAN-like [Palaemon carinicauda]|uniref:protein FAN-like n=1 Tax=Palaemon carinicauda TaxID=392227 RepID=UPI0035B6AB42